MAIFNGYPAAGALTGTEVLTVWQGGRVKNTTVAALLAVQSLSFLINLIPGQQDYNLDITPAQLTNPPRGAHVGVVAAAATDAELTGHLVKTGTTAVLAKIHIAQKPVGTTTAVMVTIIP